MRPSFFWHLWIDPTLHFTSFMRVRMTFIINVYFDVWFCIEFLFKLYFIKKSGQSFEIRTDICFKIVPKSANIFVIVHFN